MRFRASPVLQAFDDGAPATFNSAMRDFCRSKKSRLPVDVNGTPTYPGDNADREKISYATGNALAKSRLPPQHRRASG